MPAIVCVQITCVNSDSVRGFRNFHVDTLHDDIFLKIKYKYLLGVQLHSQFDEFAAEAKDNC